MSEIAGLSVLLFALKILPLHCLIADYGWIVG
jgi:hypothetical protein